MINLLPENNNSSFKGPRAPQATESGPGGPLDNNLEDKLIILKIVYSKTLPLRAFTGVPVINSASSSSKGGGNLTNIRNYSTLDFRNVPLDPNTVTGFTDGEGCFHVSITKSTDTKINWKTAVVFQFGLHISELSFLLRIQKYFNGVGYITPNVKNNIAFYTVTKFRDIVNVVIPHFLKYPLVSKKALDFHLFCRIVEVMFGKGHLNMEGLSKIVSFKASMNNGLSPSLISAFPDVKPYLPKINFHYVITDGWLVGFIAGEACFSILPQKNHFRTKFHITQHSRDLVLLEAIKSHIGTGYIYTSKNVTNYAVTSVNDCFNYILPFLNQNPLPESCNKLTNFLLWKEIVELINSKAHLTDEGRLRILDLKFKLNKYNN